MVLEVEISLAVSILVITLLAKLMHSSKRTLSKLITKLLLKNLISQQRKMEVEVNSFSERLKIEKELGERVSLWNAKQSVEEKLLTLNTLLHSRESKVKRYCNIILSVITELCRIGYILMNRQTPVAISPSHTLWPLHLILSFPTGVPGAIGAPVWGLVCSNVISIVISIVSQK